MKLNVVPFTIAAGISSCIALLVTYLYLLYWPFKLNLPFPKLAAPIPAIGGLLGKKISPVISAGTFFTVKQFIITEICLFAGVCVLAALFAIIYNILTNKMNSKYKKETL